MEINFLQILFLFFGFIIIGPTFLMPTIIAIIRNHPKKLYIALFNAMFAWTGIGWAIALIWSYSSKEINSKIKSN